MLDNIESIGGVLIQNPSLVIPWGSTFLKGAMFNICLECHRKLKTTNCLVCGDNYQKIYRCDLVLSYSKTITSKYNLHNLSELFEECDKCPYRFSCWTKRHG